MKKVLLSLAFLAIVAVPSYFYRHSFVRKTSLSATNMQRGIVFHDRLRASEGYHVLDHYLHETRCTFADNPGHEKFSFPGSFCTFLENGSVFSYFLDHLVLWQPNGLEKWKIHNYIHHDISVNEKNETVFVITWQVFQEDGVKGLTDPDVIRGYDFQGKQIYSWKILEHKKEFEAIIQQPLERHLTREIPPTYEYTHINSVQELPENSVAKQVPAFQAGNILLNDFRFGVIFVIDRRTKKIIWHYYPDGGIFAHSVRLNEDGQIVFLNNKKNKVAKGSLRYSSIDFLDPVKMEIVHSITTAPKESFSTSYWGSLQLLPQNRFLVTDSVSGTAFEIDKNGRILWEWLSPENEEDHIKPIYRVQLYPKAKVDKVLAAWKPF